MKRGFPLVSKSVSSVVKNTTQSLHLSRLTEAILEMKLINRVNQMSVDKKVELKSVSRMWVTVLTKSLGLLMLPSISSRLTKTRWLIMMMARSSTCLKKKYYQFDNKDGAQVDVQKEDGEMKLQFTKEEE